jgi:hypothetical protein
MENETLSTTTINALRTNPMSNNKMTTTAKTPYANYSGEYGKEYHHYVKMGLNESDAAQSVHKLMELEEESKEKELVEVIEDPTVSGDFIIVDVTGNEIEPLKHPLSEYVTDHHSHHHEHEENIAMVTVGCLIFGMLMFLILMMYIMRKQQQHHTNDVQRDVEFIDPKFESKKSKFPPSKIVHEPLPSKSNL